MWSDTSSTRRGFMRHTRFHPIKLAWITAVVAGLMVGVATPADAEPGQWDPTLPALVSAGAPGDPLAVANRVVAGHRPGHPDHAGFGQAVPRWVGNQPRRPCCQRSQRRHNRREPDSAGQRPSGRRICDSPGRVADGGALFVGWWLASGPQQGRGLGGQHCRLRLLRSGAVCLRRGRRADPAVLR